MEYEENQKGPNPGGKAAVISTCVFLGVGYGIAYSIYKFGSTDTYDARVAILKDYELHWMYLSAFCWSLLVLFTNQYPMQYKSKIMSSKGNLRSNMFIYQFAVQDESKSAVVLNQDGDIGLYNRGNRALYHFVENS